MATHPTTLDGLLNDIELYPAHELVFVADGQEIGAGFHVTELKKAAVNSIDCGQRLDSWNESVVQLLDGAGDQHMSVAKFCAIVRKSEAALPGLTGERLLFEFAPGNRSLQRRAVERVIAEAGRVIVTLAAEAATCKPMADWQAAAAVTCSSQTPAEPRCCG